MSGGFDADQPTVCDPDDLETAAERARVEVISAEVADLHRVDSHVVRLQDVAVQRDAKCQLVDIDR